MPLSGEEMLKRYLRGGWTIIRRRGSHLIVGLGGIRESIPMHPELGRGLERMLLKRLAATGRRPGG
jgi:predicted RNA binding protein YcfA (HicA-like mRNA interferase family)